MLSHRVPADASSPPPRSASPAPFSAARSARVPPGGEIAPGYYRGPLRYPRAAQIAEILGSPDVEQVLRTATFDEAPLLRQQARAFAEKMLPNLDCLSYNLLAVLVRGALAALFEGMHVTGTEQVRALGENTTRIYVASHAGGHADHLFQNFAVSRLGFRTPLTVASEHLDTPGIGPLLRHCGAMYLKRGGEALRTLPRGGVRSMYRAVAGAAVGTLLRGGWDLLVFPEGAPSVDGRPLRIRRGFLRDLVRQARRGLDRRVALVPVNLRHDRPFEEGVFLQVAASGTWRGSSSDNIKGLLRGLRSLRRNYGTLHMHFGRPQFLDELLATEAGSDAAASARVAAWVGQGIQAAAPLTAASLAAVSLAPATAPLAFDDVLHDATRLIAVLCAIDPEMPVPAAGITLDAQLRALCRIELVEQRGGRLATDAHQRARLLRHRNIALPRLVIPSMVCRSLLLGIDRPEAIVAEWQEAFPRVCAKLHLAIPARRLDAAVAGCIRALAAAGVVALEAGGRAHLRDEGRVLVTHLADAFDLDRDVDGHIEIS